MKQSRISELFQLIFMGVICLPGSRSNTLVSSLSGLTR
ncbi:hypothetical protein MNBD_ALPHA12-1122 [hydrothermal vent metagenome]|uniref:Uncharacterized protein n=1 Tax=hydrothermal vent metagenome TaxID=652676 RepID=A0A3B0TIX2_9ZZZZ